MLAKNLLLYLCTCITILIFTSAEVNAQTQRPFTGSNYITVVFESPNGRYEFRSPELLVRYNRATEQLECSVLINSLKPTGDTIPAGMAYDVLYGARYPELAFLIDVPEEIISEGKPYPEPINQLTSITLHGVTNQKRIPVVFSPDRNMLTFGTNFDVMLDNFESSIPARYLPVLTGRLLINITNARWMDQQ